jgi:hypothetical protein
MSTFQRIQRLRIRNDAACISSSSLSHSTINDISNVNNGNTCDIDLVGDQQNSQFHLSLQQQPTPALAAQLQLSFKISLSTALASSPLRNSSAVGIQQQRTFQRCSQI